MSGKYGHARPTVVGKIYPATKMKRVRMTPTGSIDPQLFRVEVNTGIGAETWVEITGALSLMEARRIHSVVESAWAAEKAEFFAKRRG